MTDKEEIRFWAWLILGQIQLVHDEWMYVLSFLFATILAMLVYITRESK